MAEDKDKSVPVKFKGEVKYAMVPPTEARKPFEIDPASPNDTSYSVQVECSDKMYASLIKAGVSGMTKLRTDEETGKTYINLRATKVRGDMTFADPFVVGPSAKPFTEAIGNGSVCNVFATLDKVKKGKALRLKGVQVLTHVPYVPTGGVDKFKEMMDITPDAEDEEVASFVDTSEDSDDDSAAPWDAASL